MEESDDKETDRTDGGRRVKFSDYPDKMKEDIEYQITKGYTIQTKPFFGGQVKLRKPMSKAIHFILFVLSAGTFVLNLLYILFNQLDAERFRVEDYE